MATDSADRFRTFFGQATGPVSPIPYQERLALDRNLPALLDVPTGLGKTAATILAWLWRRRFAEASVRAETPRRLVYCLPMRVLVEQTFTEAVKWLARVGLLAGEAQWTELGTDRLPTRRSRLQACSGSRDRGYQPNLEIGQVGRWAAINGDCGQCPIAIHLLLGGEDRTDWALWPERDAILIGTQDMLLSRALNRGYAAGRARWPLEFGLLNNDCLWVFDEIQLMSTGLASSLQLDAWRRSLCLRPSRDQFPKETGGHLAKPCRSLWMSATMAEHWLDSAVDWSTAKRGEWKDRAKLESDDDAHDRVCDLFAISKPIEPCSAKLKKPRPDKSDVAEKLSDYIESLAKAIRKDRSADGLTLVILNTVERAVALYKALKQGEKTVEPDLMIHSRFRPIEREKWNLQSHVGQPRIIISTQVVEAGVDLSAKVLFTELAPWASLVQRFGRCARYPGESGTIFWMEMDECWAKPYEATELAAASGQLQDLHDVGLRSLRDIRADQDDQELFPYQPRFVPRDKDLFDLFDTTPDLTGADIDVSRFIRDGEDFDVQVFWRELSGSEPRKKDWPDRDELCPVPFYRFRNALPGLRKAGRIWRRSYRKGWELVDGRDADLIYPGQVYLLEKSCGGYDTVVGWTGDPNDVTFDLPTPVTPAKETRQDDEEDAEDLSQFEQNKWLTVSQHTGHACQKLEGILRDCDLSKSDLRTLRLAARWHDRGKAHPVFQSKIELSDQGREKLAGEPAAKAPETAWRRNGSRPGFRHELASALAILETLRQALPTHEAFAWPDSLDRPVPVPSLVDSEHDPLTKELAELSPEELDLLVYLIAAHHGKVRMSIRSSPDDERVDVPDPCPEDRRQARGVRDNDKLIPCQLPSVDLKASLVAPGVTLMLDPMELGLSDKYGPSWRERMQTLLERLGPFRLAYLEGLLRAADCRASEDEDKIPTSRAQG